MVRDYQKVISKEIKEQMQAARGKLPDVVVACVGGGSNAIGTFYNFIPDEGVRLIGVEAGGEGDWPPSDSTGLRLKIEQAWMATSIAQRSPRVHRACFTVSGPTSFSLGQAKSPKRIRSAPVWTIQVLAPNTPG